MKANKISVIVPVFNVENYLEKCVKSIIEQHSFQFSKEIGPPHVHRSRHIIDR